MTSTHEDILSLCLEEMLENFNIRNAFRFYVNTNWDREGLNGGIFLLRRKSPLIALDLINRKDALKMQSFWHDELECLAIDSYIYGTCTNTPHVTLETAAHGFCCWVMDEIGIDIKNPRLKKKLEEGEPLAQTSRQFLLTTGENLEEVISKVQNIYDRDDENELLLFNNIKNFGIQKLQKAASSVAGRDVFSSHPIVQRQNEKWRRDIFTSVCEELDKRYYPYAQILGKQWEENLKGALQENFPAFESLVKILKDIENYEFNIPAFHEFVGTPEWEIFCKTMASSSGQKAEVFSLQAQLEKTDRKPRRNPWITEEGQIKEHRPPHATRKRLTLIQGSKRDRN